MKLSRVPWRSALAALVLAATAPAHAAWSIVDGNERSYDYADFATLRLADGMRRIWTLSDLLAPDADGDLSYRNLVEYDCLGGRYRVVQSIFHAGHMGTGRITAQSEQATPWRTVAEGSVGMRLMQRVCR